jgi:uncharacterized protein (DUF433 family)
MGTVTNVRVLERVMYTEANAARLLGVPQATLHYWLEGKATGQTIYPPIIRREPTGAREVTWGEFVEAGLLREYRRTHGIRMEKLRRFVDLLRDGFGVPYPLADRRPYVFGRELVQDAQTAAELDAEECLVAVANDQLLLTAPAENFVRRVEWEGDEVAYWRPDPNDDSPISINPQIRFGQPAVKGIGTHSIWELVESGEEASAVADIYGLSEGDVRYAYAYESTTQAA